MVIGEYPTFLIGEIWLGRLDGVFYFLYLAKHNLICRIWAFQFILDWPMGLTGHRFGLVLRGLGIALGIPFLWV